MGISGLETRHTHADFLSGYRARMCYNPSMSVSRIRTGLRSARALASDYFIFIIIALYFLGSSIPESVARIFFLSCMLVLSVNSLRRTRLQLDRPQTKWMLLGTSITILSILFLTAGVFFFKSDLILSLGVAGVMGGMILHTWALTQRSRLTKPLGLSRLIAVKPAEAHLRNSSRPYT